MKRAIGKVAAGVVLPSLGILAASLHLLPGCSADRSVPVGAVSGTPDLPSDRPSAAADDAPDAVAPSPEAPVPGGSIELRISRPDGSPVPDATLELLRFTDRGLDLPSAGTVGPPWGLVSRAATDREGRGFLARPEPGIHRVRVSAPGRATEVRRLRPTGEEEPGPLSFSLEEGHSLVVEVLDDVLRPLEGVRVRLGWGEVALEAAAVADGAIRFEGVAAGNPTVEAVLPSGVVLSGGPIAVPGVARFRMAVGPGTVVRGRVLDADTGEPIPDAGVHILGPFPPAVPWRGAATVTTGTDGSFAVDRFPGIPVQVMAAAPGYLQERWRVGALDPGGLGAAGPFDLVLRAERVIRGRVLGEDGNPIAGAYVQLAQSTGDGAFRVGAGARTEADGSYRLGGARPGPAMVKASAPGWWQPDFPNLPSSMVAGGPGHPPPCSVTVPELGEATLDLVLRRGGTVSGTLVDPVGRSLGETPLEVVRESGFPEGFATTREDGSFAFHGIRPGRDLLVRSSGAGHGRECTPRVDLPEGGNAEGLLLTLPVSPEVRGVVLEATGSPAAGAEVRILPGLPHPGFDPGGWPSARTGSDGSFRIPLPTPGTIHSAVVLHPGHGETVVRIETASPGGIPSPIEVRLEPENLLRGEVVDEEGRPVPGAVISAGFVIDSRAPPARTGPAPRVRCTADGAGRFMVEGLSAGARVVGASAPGLLPGTVPVGDGEVRLVLLRPRRLTGRLVEAESGAPVAGVGIRAGGDGSGWNPSFGHAVSDGEGVFVIGGLRPGAHRIHVEAGPGWIPEVPGEVEPGSGEVVVTLHPGFALAGRVVDEEGRPMELALVQVVGEGDPRFRVEAQTRADGSFRFGPLRSGRYRLRGSPPGWRLRRSRTGAPVPAEVAGVEAGREDVEIRLFDGRDLHGRVVDETGTATDLAFWVNAHPEGTERATRSGALQTRAGADGDFVLGGLDPRVPLDLVLSGQGRGVGGVLRGVRPGGDPVTLVLEPGRTIEGRVLDGEGEPIAGIPIRAEAMEVLGIEDGVKGRASSSGDGSFMLGGLGIFRFRVRADTSGTAWAPEVRETSTAERAVLEFRLRPGAAIEGRVLGTGSRETYVDAQPAGTDRTEWTRTRVREDGTFLLRGLAPGPHRIRLHVPRQSPATRDVGVVDAPAAGVVLGGK